MRTLFFALTILVSTNLTAHQETQLSQEILDSSEEGIWGVMAGKAYFHTEKLTCFHGEWFLQNDLQQWISLGTTMMRDHFGYYAYAEPRCPRGHIGFKRDGKIWYCFEEHCPYFFGDHF